MRLEDDDALAGWLRRQDLTPDDSERLTRESALRRRFHQQVRAGLAAETRARDVLDVLQGATLLTPDRGRRLATHIAYQRPSRRPYVSVQTGRRPRPGRSPDRAAPPGLCGVLDAPRWRGSPGAGAAPGGTEAEHESRSAR